MHHLLLITLILSSFAAFLAGLVDSIAGGGGLIQVPALLFLFPTLPVVTLLATNKFVNAIGTSVASARYVKALEINLKFFSPTLVMAFLGSLLGAKVLSLIHNEMLRPLVFFLLLIIGFYTLLKKDLGSTNAQKREGLWVHFFLITIGAIIGFYDGFFGPGTGSFLIFSFVGLLGFSFLEGSAFAKLTNLSANFAAAGFFIYHDDVKFSIALPMIIFNILGNYVGSGLAIKKGSQFVRWIFLFVILGLIIEALWQWRKTHVG